MIFSKLHLYMITTELAGLPNPSVTSISVHEEVAPVPIHDDVADGWDTPVVFVEIPKNRFLNTDTEMG